MPDVAQTRQANTLSLAAASNDIRSAEGRTPSATIARSSAHALAASVVGVGVGLAASIVVARSLGPSAKGTYDLVLATATLLALVLGFSMPSGVTFAVARRIAAPRPLLWWILGIGLAQAIVAAVIVATLSPGVSATLLGSAGSDGAFRITLPLLVGLGCIAPSLRAILIGEQRVALASWLDVAGRTLTLGTLVAVALLATQGPSASALVAATALGATAAAVLYLPGVLRAARARGQVVRRSRWTTRGAGLRTVIRFAMPSYGANVMQYLNYRLDLFIVAYFRDLREVGLYALATTLTQLIWLVSNAVATAVFARVSTAAEAPGDAARRTAALSRGVLAIQIVLACALALLAKPLLLVLYGSAFEPAAAAVWLLLPGVAVFGTVGVLAAHHAGIGRPGLNLLVSASSLAVTVGLDLVLIPRFGMYGAALASTAAYASAAVVMTLLFRRATGVGFREVLVIRGSDLRRLVRVGRAWA